MAHPLLITELAVKQFVSQWNCGLRPSLQLTTKSDGSVLVASTVTSCPDLQNCFIYSSTQRRRSRKAAASSRRKINRSMNDHAPPNSVTANVFKPILQENTVQEKATISSDQPVTTQVVDVAIQVSSPTADAECEPDPALLQTKTLSKKPNLSMSKMCSTSLPPRPIYHPAVINASKSIHGGKHPSELNQEEA